MNRYDMAIIVTVDADNYEAAEQTAKNIAAWIGYLGRITCSVVLAYEHDNDGQRVVYLHPENEVSVN